MIGLVIDADIARSSGTTEHPVSSSSRQLLELVLSMDGKACFCTMLLAEWNKHQSAYTKKWRATMYSRKKISIVSHNDATKTFLQNLPTTKMQAAAVKDSHLIDISNQANKIILSNDSIARNAFSTLLSGNALINNVYWISPLTSLPDISTYVMRKRIIPTVHLL